MRYGCFSFLLLSVVIIVCAEAPAATFTWNGGAGAENLSWGTNENWLDNLAPPNPTAERVLFVDPLAPNSLMDASWSIGRLEFRSPEDTATAACSYSLDLGAGTLGVANLWVSQYGGGGNLGNNKAVNVLFTNGTLQVGTPATPGDLLISNAVWLSGEALVSFGAGTTLRGYLRNLYVGENADQNSTGQAILDFGGCTIEGGALNAANVRISTGKRAAAIKLYPANGVGSIAVAGSLEIGNGASASGRIGDPSLLDSLGNWQLPANISVQIGSEGARGNLYVGRSTLAGAYGAIVASSGGTFQAWLNNLEVGTKNETSGYSQDRSAYLDLREMTSATLDATRIKIGTASTAKASGSKAEVRLPAGTAAAGTLEVGHPSTSGTCSALLELNETTLSVETSAILYDKGTIRTTVRGTSCGLDLATTATMSVTATGKLEIVFEREAAGSEIYWGLRWEGSHAGELQPLVDSGIIEIDNSAVAGVPAVIAQDGYTYVAIVDEVGLTAVARNRMIEVLDPGDSITVSVEDIDAGSNDPRGYVITTRSISSPDDSDADPSTVTLTGLGAHPVTLTVTNDNTPPDVATADCTVTLDVPGTTLGDVTWSGADSMSRTDWVWGANWQAGLAPANPTNAMLTFTEIGAGTTSISEPWTIGKLQYRTTEGPTPTPAEHTLDLGGGLLATGELRACLYGGTGNLGNGGSVSVTITNGTLQLGTPEAPADVTISRTTWLEGAASIVMDEGTTLDAASLRNVLVGADQFGMGTLDLRGATIVDGTISAASFEVGKHNKHNSSVMIDADSGLQRLEVLGTLGIGQCAAGSARFGDPDTLDESGNWMLPPNVDITVGVNDAVRGNVYVGKSTLAGCYGALIASSGGSFQAYLNDLEVGTKAEGAGYSQDLSAWLDLSSMSSFFLDAARIKIGTATLTTASGSQAIVRFPAGTAVIATLEVGHPSFADNCSAALELNNTEVDVFTSVHVYDKGTVTVHVGATPCGLDLDTAATLAIDDGGKIEIIFDTEPSGTETHWGLRWAGNHAGILQPLADAGKLTWDTYAVSGPAGIVFKDGFTYVALVEEQGLVAIARDLTVEFLPPDFPSVTISVDMIDSGSNDPRGHAIVSRAISSPSDTVPGDELVTLGWAGDHTVTLTVTNNNVPPDVATVDCTVVVVDASASSRETGAVVWSGGDPIGRGQWIWGANWIGGNAPANPTQADVFFMLDGSSTDETITNELEDDWAVGKLRFRTPEGSTATNIRHTTDLAGYTLTAGHLWISQYGGGGNLGNGGSVGVTINNGTLQIGSEQAKGDLLVSNAVWYNAAAELIFGTGVTLRPYLRNMYVGENADQAPAGEAAIDFGSASIENNELKAENVRISTGKRTAAIKLYAGNQVERIEVSGSLKIGDGAAASGRFGDPALTDVDGNWKLAPNTHVRVGTDENTRGELIIGRSTLAGAYGALVMSEGGSFNAYLTDLQVGTKLASSGYWQSRHAFLDLRSVASFSLDAQNVKIGPAAAVKSDAARAEVRLPAGLAKVSNLQVGHPSTANNCSALLQLAGTTTQVSGQTDVGDSGTILIEVGGTSSGLDLAAGAGLTVQDGALPANNGKIRIVFSTPSASGLYWGLRWEGDHAADLQALADVGKLTWDDTALPGGASIFTQGGFTMLGAALNMARVNSFIVSDRTSGSVLITNEAAVAVAITGEPAEGAAIDGYAVNESGVEPAAGDWQSSLASYTIQAPSGSNVTLYAWVKDTAGNVASKSAAIHYNSAVPVVSAIEIADNGDGTATATWATDILAEGSLRYGPVALSGATPNEIKESALGTEHSATFAFAAATNCKLVLANTEAASAPIYWPNPWPIDGDSNMDCRVNILDLIFIRNKLNLDVNSGDNWKADVNQDTRINILDLIFVRNKLNTQCP